MIKINNLSKVYGTKDNKVAALDNVSFEINKGEFVAIVGASGSGKSTLLNMLGGLDKPSSGEVIIDGESITKLKEKDLAVFRRRKIGFVFQFFNLIQVLTVEENIALPISLDHGKVDKNYINEIMDILNIRHRRKHLPSQLSGGEQQRVSIGRALAYKPGIILADEPTGNLDSKNSSEVIALLKGMAKKYNQTLVVITHDMSIASEADRVICIGDGKIVKDGGANIG
ncbi:MAG: ABC transporter ATP-binding protein [Clostridium sp.]